MRFSHTMRLFFFIPWCKKSKLKSRGPADLRAFRGQFVLPEGHQEYHFFFLPMLLLAGQNLVYILGYILWWSASVDLEASCACALSAGKMTTLLRDGCLVSVFVAYFDIPGTQHEDKWSVATLGEGWESERCHGTVWKVLSGGQFARVRWDIDRCSQCVGVPNLQLEAEEGGLESPAEGRTVFSLSATQAPVMLLMKKPEVKWFWWWCQWK